MKEKLIKLMNSHAYPMKVGSDGDYEVMDAIDFESFNDLADDILKLTDNEVLEV